MSIKFHVYTEQKLTVIKYQGVIRDSDFNIYQDIFMHPATSPGMNALVDLREITSLEVTSNGIRNLGWMISQHKQDAPTFRSGVIATDDAIYGMARMYELIHDESAEQTRVFRTVAEAFAWVGIPEDKSLLDF